MTLFYSLDELDNYVHHCLICQKEMQIQLETTILPIKGKHDRWASGRENVRMKLKRDGDNFVSQHKSHNLVINASTNEIVEGTDFANRITHDFTYINKSCSTCHMKVESRLPSSKINKILKFPALTLQKEELRFTLKGGKTVGVYKFHDLSVGVPSEEGNAQIRLNDKALPPVPFEFNKINSFEHLINRLNMIIVFH